MALREIDPPHRLKFKWRSEGRIVATRTVVAIDLGEHGAFTELTLVQDPDPSTDEGRAHREGRKGTLTNPEESLRSRT